MSKRQNQEQFFERFDRAYYTSGGYKDYLQRFQEESEAFTAAMLNCLKPPKQWRFLDVGCGMGGVILALRQRGFEAFGSEISPFCLAESPAREFMTEGSADALPFKNDSFDTVLCVDALEYFTRPQMEKVITELVRVSKESIVLSTFYGNSPVLDDEDNPDPLRHADIKDLSEADILTMFASAGAEFVDRFTVDYELYPQFHGVFKKNKT